MKVSDVQDMMNKLATQGMGEGELLTNAIETALTENIVPYLTNLEDSSMQQLNAVTNGEMMRQVRGIARVNNDLYDDNTVATKYLQQQLEYLAPMASVAGLQLIQNDEQMMTYYQGLRKQGMSDYLIGQNINSVNRMRYDQYGTLRNGSPLERVSLIDSYVNGINPLLDGVGFANQYEQTAQMFGNMTPSDGGLLTSAARSAWGFSDDRVGYYYSNTNLDLNTAYSNAKKSNYGSAGDAAAELFASGANQTAQQKQEATLENLSTEIALWKVDTGVWFDVLTTAVQGIAKILIGWAIGKGVGSIFGAGNAGGGIGTLASNLTGFGAKGISGIGSGATASAGGVAAGLGTVAGVAAGGAFAYDGVKGVVNDFNEGDVNGGTALKAGEAVAGGVAAGAFLAAGLTNPVGWVALIGAACFAVGKELYESANSYKKAGKEVEKQWNNQILSLNKEVRNREKSLMKTEEYLQSEEDTEKARQELINSGMLSEEDMQKAEKASREELMKLTEQYKLSTEDFSKAGNEILNELKGKQAGQATETVKSIQDWMKNDAFKNYNDTNYQLLMELRDTMVEKIEAKGDAASDDEKEYLKRVNKNKGKGNNGQADLIWEFDSWDDGYKSVATALTKQNLEDFSKYANQKGKTSIKIYDYIDSEEAQNYIDRLSNATSKEALKSAIQGLKDLGYSSKDSLPTYTKDLVERKMKQLGVTEYRVGASRIPYDNYPALLHEGEAVLTASTANELSSLIDEYRETRDDSIKITQAIEEQTAALIERLDAIYTKMPSSAEAQAQEIMPRKIKSKYKTNDYTLQSILI